MSESKSPKAEAPKAAAPAAPVRSLFGGTRNNVWRVRVLDRDGNPVDTDGTGATSMVLKGPATREDLIRSAAILLNGKRADAMRAGLEDPGYHIDEASIEPQGHTDDDIGGWFPAGARPISLPTDPAAQAARAKLIAERLGTVIP